MKRQLTVIFVMLFLLTLLPETSVWGERNNKGKDSVRIAQLLEELARSKRRKVNFTETKIFQSLDLKLKSSGIYIFRSAGLLEKITEVPSWERVLIDEDSISIETKDESHVISINQLPSLKIIIESIRSVFSGNLNVLRKIFIIKLQAEHNAWSLQLSPRDSGLNQLIETVTFSGTRNHVSNIRIIQFDGDEILISLN